MPKRRSSPSRSRAPLILVALAALALILFLAGELFAFLTSDNGRLVVARHLHVGERARLVRIVGKRIREGLASAGVPADHVQEQVLPAGGGPALRWSVDLPREGSPLQLNYAVTRAVERGGASVLSARERPGENGSLRVTMRIGLPGRPTHELVIVRAGRLALAAPGVVEARVALVLYGLGEEPALAKTLLAGTETFAVAVSATGEGHEALLRAVHATHREVVLQIPMEPENYPRVNPGPGTLLVNMPARRIEGLAHDYLRSAAPVTAVSNLMGSFATQDEPFMSALYQELRRAGVSFLHVAPVPRAVCKPLAAQLGVAYDEPTRMIDAETRAKKPVALERSWKVALEHARLHGHAVVLMRVTPLSAKWLQSARAHAKPGEWTLVPLASVLHRPGGQ